MATRKQPASASGTAAKPAAKSTAKIAAKPETGKAPPAATAKPVAKSLAGKAAAVAEKKPAAPAAAKKDAAEPKAGKPKLVRDSFTMPKAEYAAIDVLKQRAAKLARPAKKSELLRAGIKALSALGDKALLEALGAVPTIKTGRPNKN